MVGVRTLYPQPADDLLAAALAAALDTLAAAEPCLRERRPVDKVATIGAGNTSVDAVAGVSWDEKMGTPGVSSSASARKMGAREDGAIGSMA